MFYATDRNDHGLTHDPFKAIVTPRPIGWITSRSAKGEINLAPYSYFNGMSSRPPVVCFSSEGRKDSLTFIEETGEFVCNLATYDLRLAVNETSLPIRAAPMRCLARASRQRLPASSRLHGSRRRPARLSVAGCRPCRYAISKGALSTITSCLVRWWESISTTAFSSMGALTRQR